MNKLPITICLFISFLLTSCLKDNGEIFQRYDVVYADEKVNEDSLDFYFSENKEKYPSYEESKKNDPNLLDGVKYIKTNLKTMKVLKFNDNPIGFLSGTSFLCFDYNYYYLSSGFGGYGLTEFVIKKNSSETWMYFITSSGSGIHRSYVEAFRIDTKESYSIEGLELESFKDYTFVTNIDGTFDLFEADIEVSRFENDFETYKIQKTKFAFGDIHGMSKKKIESQN